ncbi:MAG: DNA polymerase III subunit delta [Flavobacteriales bacterium]|nr:DNA polymerase III subunit delta [Flavobacteriales bacterium]
MAKKSGTSFEDLRSAIQSRDFKPVYLLQGDEAWFIDELVADFEKYTLEEHERDFNMSIFYGKDSSIEQVVSASQRFPMMAERQLVIVKEAQDLDGWRREADRDYLQKYCENATPTTVLVFAHKYKKLAGNTKVFKALAAVGEVFQAEKISQDRLPGWIVAQGNQKGINISQGVAFILSEYLGSDLSKVMHAIEKLQFTVGDTETITAVHVEKYIGISKDYNVFELQTAIASADHVKANQIMNYFAANQKEHPIYMTLGFLFSFYSKLMIYHGERDKSNNNVARKMKLPWHVVDSYRAAAANIPELKTMQNISVLRKYDKVVKGMAGGTMPMLDLHRQLIQELMN